MTGEKLTRVVDLLPYVRAFWFYELANEDSIRSLRVIRAPWRRGGFHAFRAVFIYFFTMGLSGFGFLAYTKGSYGSAVILIAVAFAMALGNLTIAVNQAVLVLTADTLMLQRGPLPWWSRRRFGLEEPITVRAQTNHGKSGPFYFLEVMVGPSLARWGDFASLDDAVRVAAFVGREVDVRQGRAPALPEPTDAGSSQENAPGGVVVSVPRGELAFTEPGRRLASLLLIAFGATLVILGGLVTVWASIVVVTSRELRYPLLVIIPLCLTVLGAVLFRHGLRVRPRG